MKEAETNLCFNKWIESGLKEMEKEDRKTGDKEDEWRHGGERPWAHMKDKFI